MGLAWWKEKEEEGGSMGRWETWWGWGGGGECRQGRAWEWTARPWRDRWARPGHGVEGGGWREGGGGGGRKKKARHHDGHPTSHQEPHLFLLSLSPFFLVPPLATV